MQKYISLVIVISMLSATCVLADQSPKLNISYNYGLEALKDGIEKGKEDVNVLPWGIFGFVVYGIPAAYILPVKCPKNLTNNIDIKYRISFEEGYKKGVRRKRATAAWIGFGVFITIIQAYNNTIN